MLGTRPEFRTEDVGYTSNARISAAVLQGKLSAFLSPAKFSNSEQDKLRVRLAELWGLCLRWSKQPHEVAGRGLVFAHVQVSKKRELDMDRFVTKVRTFASNLQ